MLTGGGIAVAGLDARIDAVPEGNGAEAAAAADVMAKIMAAVDAGIVC